MQLVNEEDEHKFDFDLLDSTKVRSSSESVFKLIVVAHSRGYRPPPEHWYPDAEPQPVDYFTDVEEVAFCTQHIVPGMGFSSDPLLAGRNFSYQDTQ